MLNFCLSICNMLKFATSSDFCENYIRKTQLSTSYSPYIPSLVQSRETWTLPAVELSCGFPGHSHCGLIGPINLMGCRHFQKGQDIDISWARTAVAQNQGGSIPSAGENFYILFPFMAKGFEVICSMRSLKRTINPIALSQELTRRHLGEVQRCLYVLHLT